MTDQRSPASMSLIRDEMVALMPRLRRFCHARTRSVEVGDDLAQSTIERALSRIDQWQPGTRLDSWMFRIAQNLSIDEARVKARRGKQVGVDALESISGEDGHRIVEDRSDLARVRQAIAALPDDQRTLVALVIIDGQSYKEAAAIIDVPVGTVMSRLSRARQSIDNFVNSARPEFADLTEKQRISDDRR